jgi:hypothetical protein
VDLSTVHGEVDSLEDLMAPRGGMEVLDLEEGG